MTRGLLLYDWHLIERAGDGGGLGPDPAAIAVGELDEQPGVGLLGGAADDGIALTKMQDGGAVILLARALKAAGITPISLGEKDSWTGMHIWSYLATRICGQAKFLAAADRTGGAFTDPCFVQAGTDLKQLIDLQPFQAGFLGASHDDMQGTFGNGKAAMELSGQWAPGSEAGQAADKKGVANLGMFNFPAVEGGAGDVTDVMGGGNGFAIGKNAPPEAVDFVKYLTAPEQQARVAASGGGIPVVKGGEVGLTAPDSKANPAMIEVQKSFAAAKYFQLYYDQYMPSAMGGILNDAVAKLYAGTSTPEQVAQEVEAGAKQTFGK